MKQAVNCAFDSDAREPRVVSRLTLFNQNLYGLCYLRHITRLSQVISAIIH